MRRKYSILLALLVLSLVVAGCTPGNTGALQTELANLQAANAALTGEVASLKQQLGQLPAASVLHRALVAVDHLKTKDMTALASLVHPSKGVRFTPYSYVDLPDDQVFTAAQLPSLLQSSQTYLWGEYDGSGEPIQLDFSAYYAKFVYDVDFANPHMIGNNVSIGTGNSLNNLSQAYPNRPFVEFHFTGFDPQYGGMDWRSLSLVFEELSGVWYLVGIVHGQWTI